MMDLILVILDLFEQAFNRCREVDLKLNPEKVNILMDQIICNGCVLTTDSDTIMSSYNEIVSKNDYLTQGLTKIGTWTSYFKGK